MGPHGKMPFTPPQASQGSQGKLRGWKGAGGHGSWTPVPPNQGPPTYSPLCRTEWSPWSQRDLHRPRDTPYCSPPWPQRDPHRPQVTPHRSSGSQRHHHRPQDSPYQSPNSYASPRSTSLSTGTWRRSRPDICSYYKASMLEDPWAELQLQQAQTNSLAESTVSE